MDVKNRLEAEETARHRMADGRVYRSEDINVSASQTSFGRPRWGGGEMTIQNIRPIRIGVFSKRITALTSTESIQRTKSNNSRRKAEETSQEKLRVLVNYEETPAEREEKSRIGCSACSKAKVVQLQESKDDTAPSGPGVTSNNGTPKK